MCVHRIPFLDTHILSHMVTDGGGYWRVNSQKLRMTSDLSFAKFHLLSFVNETCISAGCLSCHNSLLVRTCRQGNTFFKRSSHQLPEFTKVGSCMWMDACQLNWFNR